jgi:ribonuclease HI
MMMNGDVMACESSCRVLVLVGGHEFSLDCLVTELLPGFDMLLGMDAVAIIGGVRIGGDGSVTFANVVSAAAQAQSRSLELKDEDFSANFSNGKWEVRWNWNGEVGNLELENNVSQYKIPEDAKCEFDTEVGEWIENGWLQTYEGKCNGLIPLMAVIQRNKKKVRPVLDYRELNQYVSSHTGQSEVCGDRLRIWRQMGANVKLLDLRKAYLQLHVAEDLWKYQVVRFQGKQYCLTRLGFGLNVAPKIMAAIVHKVLSLDAEVERGTDSYIDDIIVNEDIVSCEKVKCHLSDFGLESKPEESLVGGRVLGLRVYEGDQTLMWKRDNVVEKVSDHMTKREVFSICGQLVGHFPVCGWLRPACSFIKRRLNDCKWSEAAAEKTMKLVNEVLAQVAREDPVKGQWCVKNIGSGRVWCDASSLAIGVCLEINGAIVEDSTWLRKQGDAAHINLAELEAIIKGVNLAIKWSLNKLEVMTDSATVYHWLNSLLTKDRRIRTHGMGEALVHRRLSLLADLLKECNISMSVSLVKSHENKADLLTRVPKRWLDNVCISAVTVASGPAIVHVNEEIIASIHNLNHLGVNRTFYLVKKCHPNCNIRKTDVEKVVKKCMKCKSIDPAPLRMEKGTLDVDEVWFRVACDVTHYEGKTYLTLIDCGPSRFAIWKLIIDESAEHVIKNIEEMFRERGPPKELLLDNSKTFHSQHLLVLCKKWKVRMIFRCAYRPQGNGIIERNHRTIKRMAARTGKSILDMVYWYNITPKNDSREDSVPSSILYSYPWRCPAKVEDDENPKIPVGFEVGENVFVKPNGAKCSTEWSIGVVSGLGERGVIEINGIPRHATDIRSMKIEEKFPNNVNQQLGVKGGEDDDTGVEEIVSSRLQNPMQEQTSAQENVFDSEQSRQEMQPAAEWEDSEEVDDGDNVRRQPRKRRKPFYLNDYAC